MKSRHVIRRNPDQLPPPVGRYSHVTIIPKNADLYAFSGQVGIDDAGNIPDDLNEQMKNTFRNIERLLESQGLLADDVIKVNIWSTEEIDWDILNGIWEQLFGEVFPSMTIGYVQALGLSEIKFEVEMWAAKCELPS